jgi:hypothetical protein
MHPLKPVLQAVGIAGAQTGTAIPELPFKPRRLTWSRDGSPWAEVEITLLIHADWALPGCAITSIT